MKCVCGHWHTATCPQCGCPYPDDGLNDTDKDLIPPPDPYRGIYHPPGGYQP